MRRHPYSTPDTVSAASWHRLVLWAALIALCLLPPRGAPAEARLRVPATPHALAEERPESWAPPLSRAHAHNDYEHERPLLDALAMGFTSVEVDVWLVNGALLVAHDWFATSHERTLESLYLRPLLERALANHGRIHPAWPHAIQLLIDIKSDSERTYLAVHRLLERYRLLFTTFVGGRAHESAVTAVISGNRARQLMQRQHLRYAAYDGRIADVGQSDPATFAPLISDRWHALFDWEGDGAMPADERRRLHEHVRRAHASGQRIRFWSTPDTSPHREAVWAELVAAEVDHINTDHLPALSHWLREREPRPNTLPGGSVGGFIPATLAHDDQPHFGLGAPFARALP